MVDDGGNHMEILAWNTIYYKREKYIFPGHIIPAWSSQTFEARSIAPNTIRFQLLGCKSISA